MASRLGREEAFTRLAIAGADMSITNHFGEDVKTEATVTLSLSLSLSLCLSLCLSLSLSLSQCRAKSESEGESKMKREGGRGVAAGGPER